MNTTIGERLRRERKRRGEYQDQVAARFEITQPSYSRWESGRLLPDHKHYSAIANYLGMDIEEVWQVIHNDDARPVTLESLREEIAALQRDVADMRVQLAGRREP